MRTYTKYKITNINLVMLCIVNYEVCIMKVILPVVCVVARRGTYYQSYSFIVPSDEVDMACKNVKVYLL